LILVCLTRMLHGLLKISQQKAWFLLGVSSASGGVVIESVTALSFVVGQAGRFVQQQSPNTGGVLD
jgi:hypothetical protein